ncbi:MAG: ASCH domain-containing protein [Alphaproteobacteria bacterium]|jgi:predicted transcriptional regulator|nr:ASCH domain-containing protein [Alphaproteobacteria bacterium]
MRKILISINPKHVQNIITGVKKYEYRKTAAKEDISSIIIYETMPIKKIVAEVQIIDVITLPPKELWRQTKESSGITKKFFDEYFKNRDVGYAYQLGEVTVYDKPKQLTDFGIKYAPQSFVYI